MSQGFKVDVKVIKNDEIFIVLESNMINTTVKTLDGIVTTRPTEEFSLFTVPSAL
jgi:hypothetical protein